MFFWLGSECLLLDFNKGTILLDVACEVKFFFYYNLVYTFFSSTFFIDEETIFLANELVAALAVVPIGTNFVLLWLTYDFCYVYFVEDFFYTSVFFVSGFAGLGRLEFKETFLTDLGFIIFNILKLYIEKQSMLLRQCEDLIYKNHDSKIYVKNFFIYFRAPALN